MLFHAVGCRLMVGLIYIVCASQGVQAQDLNASSAAADQPLLEAKELDALLAPIALHPDALVAEILMASTYPLEVVHADRWVRSKGQLKEDRLKAEADKQVWDQSVKSLVATPAVLEMMAKRLDWTEKLGNAVLAQQTDVMAAIQRLRLKAYDNSKLTSTKEQTVTVRQGDNNRIVEIEPAAPGVISVPYYDPAVVYEPWPYSDYPPYYFAAPDYIPSGLLAYGIAFGAGYLLGRWTDGGNRWGGGIYWDRGDITIGRPVGGEHLTHWRHNPQHRRGVQYAHASVRQKFARIDGRPGRNARDNTLGKAGSALKSGAAPVVGHRESGDRKSAPASAKKKGAAKRTSASKVAAAKAKYPTARQRKAHASARSARARRSQPSAARTRSAMPRPRAAFGGRGAHSFGGGFRGGGFGGGRGRR